MVTAYLIARRRGYASRDVSRHRAAVATRFVAALPGLLLVFLIFGGIRAGIFTAVESASIAVLYAIAVTALVYRSLPFGEFVKAVRRGRADGGHHSVRDQRGGRVRLVAGVPAGAAAAVVAAIRAVADDPFTVLILMNVVLLVLGTFMDMAPLIIICTPIFLPVATAFGVNPLQFGMVLILNAGIGLITPPVGSVLFVGTAIGKIGIAEAMRTIWPFYAAALTVLLLVTYLPELSLWLPGALR